MPSSIAISSAFVAFAAFCWVDPEWLDALKHSLAHLWSMYEDNNTARIKEKL
jgi:hypothetical protein